MKIAVIGAKGQLGSDVVKVLSAERNFEILSLNHLEMDVRDFDSVKRSIESTNPDWVINTAAYHKLADCEQNPDFAFAVNAAGAKHVAQAANQIGSRVIHISTDYVFRGDINDEESYSVDSEPDPINVYGKSKLAGEQEVLASHSQNSVVRISSVFGVAGSSGKGGNFVESIVSQLKNGRRPSVVAEGKMSPTYTVSAAEFIHHVIMKNLSGTFHGSNMGSVSWFEFADQVATAIGMEGQIDPAPGSWETVPARPRNTSLVASRLDGFLQKDWQTSLQDYLVEKAYIN